VEPFDATFRLDPPAGPAREGPCRVALESDGLTVAPAAGAPLRVAFTRLASWTAADFAVTLALDGGGTLRLSMLGRRYQPFLAALPVARAADLGQALLLLEPDPSAEETGAFRWRGAAGEPEACRLRLQRTSTVVFPASSLPFVVPLGEVTDLAFDEGAWAVALTLRDGRTLEAVRFGRRTEALRRGLEERRQALSARALRALSALLPDRPPLALAAVGALLPDGVLAERRALEAASPGAFEAILHRSFAAGLRRETALHLAGRSQAAWLAVKEVAGQGEAAAVEPAEPGPSDAEPPDTGPPPAGATLPAELEGRQVLFLFQVEAGLALEIPSSQESATYVFRAGADPSARAAAVARALSVIRYRREVISLPAVALEGPRGARYLEALRLVPELAAARAAFAGRAIHASEATWKKGLEAALAAAAGSPPGPGA
jgi:hypothetical protein